MTEPLQLSVPRGEVDDLRRRIASTRWPDDVADDWSRGTQPSALRELMERWLEHDWAEFEDRVNAEDHQLVPTSDGRVHVWRRGPADAPTIVLVHGWPDSFLRYADVGALLAEDFQVLVPSVPGYGFSDAPTHGETGPAWTAARIAEAVEGLGIDRYGLYGGDIGTSITEMLALRHPERVFGLNLADIPTRFAADDDLSAEEQDWLDRSRKWFSAEGAYAHLHSTKPQTLAASLNDSPAGLASWILEKLQAWGEGDASERLSWDFVLDNLSLYWFTRTAGSAARYYYERSAHPPEGPRVTVPTGFGLFPHDIVRGPRSFADRWYPVEQFTHHERGGHFGAVEEPRLLADDLRTFFTAVAD